MPNIRLRSVLRPNIRRDRLRRTFKGQTGGYRTTTLGNASGVVVGSRIGYYYVRDIASSDENGNVTYGAPYQLPLKPGAVVWPRPKREVNVGFDKGQEFILGMVFDDLIQSGTDPIQFNTADPRNNYKLIEDLQNLQAYPDGNGTIQVMPSIYRKSDGDYAIFGGQSAIDIVTGNTPSSGNQVVVCQWLNETTNTLTYTVSSEVSIGTDLRLAPATALTYINECAASAPYGAIGITAWILEDDTTSISINNKFHDLRGVLGAGINSGLIGYPDPVTSNLVIPSGYTLLVDSGWTINSGASVTVGSGASVVTVNGTEAQEAEPLIRPYATKTSAYTITASDSRIRVDASGGAVTITLPDAATVDGYQFDIKAIDVSGGSVTIDTTSSQLIDGATTATLNTQYDNVTVASFGTGWDIL